LRGHRQFPDLTGRAAKELLDFPDGMRLVIKTVVANPVPVLTTARDLHGKAERPIFASQILRGRTIEAIGQPADLPFREAGGGPKFAHLRRCLAGQPVVHRSDKCPYRRTHLGHIRSQIIPEQDHRFFRLISCLESTENLLMGGATSTRRHVIKAVNMRRCITAGKRKPAQRQQCDPQHLQRPSQQKAGRPHGRAEHADHRRREGGGIGKDIVAAARQHEAQLGKVCAHHASGMICIRRDQIYAADVQSQIGWRGEITQTDRIGTAGWMKILSGQDIGSRVPSRTRSLSVQTHICHGNSPMFPLHSPRIAATIRTSERASPTMSGSLLAKKPRKLLSRFWRPECGDLAAFLRAAEILAMRMESMPSSNRIYGIVLHHSLLIASIL